jgi:hypothetical protein
VTLRTLAVVALIAGGATGIVQGIDPEKAVNQLDQATARQCFAHDWPAHQHQNHLDFCREYGYEVGPSK